MGVGVGGCVGVGVGVGVGGCVGVGVGVGGCVGVGVGVGGCVGVSVGLGLHAAKAAALWAQAKRKNRRPLCLRCSLLARAALLRRAWPPCALLFVCAVGRGQALQPCGQVLCAQQL